MNTRRKLQLIQYEQLAQERGFVFLDPKVIGVKFKHRWLCDNNHIFSACYSHIKYCNSGCPICAGSLPKTLNDYLVLAELKGFKLIKMGATTKDREGTIWECSASHQWAGSYESIRMGKSGCIYCSKRARKTETDYVNLAETQGITFIGPVPKTSREKTYWLCHCSLRTLMYKTFICIRECPDCPICCTINRSGVNSTLFNPNISIEDRSKNRWYDPITRLWVKQVYENCNYSCLKCGIRKNPNAHHIYNWGDYPDLRYNIFNGIVLCESSKKQNHQGCHEKFHSIYGKRYNSLEDLIKFIPEKQKYLASLYPLISPEFII